MIIKICGIQNEDTLICCEKNNVNFFGMIFYQKSPRNISFKDASVLQKIFVLETKFNFWIILHRFAKLLTRFRPFWTRLYLPFVWYNLLGPVINPNKF